MMRNLTPLSAGLRTRRTDLSEERQFPRGSQLRSISAALCKSLTLLISTAVATGRAAWSMDHVSCTEKGRTERGRAPGWTDSPFHSSPLCVSDCLSSCLS